MVRVLITERMIICIREIVIKTITIVIKMNCEVKSIENKETLIRTRNWSNKERDKNNRIYHAYHEHYFWNG